MIQLEPSRFREGFFIINSKVKSQKSKPEGIGCVFFTFDLTFELRSLQYGNNRL